MGLGSLLAPAETGQRVLLIARQRRSSRPPAAGGALLAREASVIFVIVTGSPDHRTIVRVTRRESVTARLGECPLGFSVLLEEDRKSGCLHCWFTGADGGGVMTTIVLTQFAAIARVVVTVIRILDHGISPTQTVLVSRLPLFILVADVGHLLAPDLVVGVRVDVVVVDVVSGVNGGHPDQGLLLCSVSLSALTHGCH